MDKSSESSECIIYREHVKCKKKKEERGTRKTKGETRTAGLASAKKLLTRKCFSLIANAEGGCRVGNSKTIFFCLRGNIELPLATQLGNKISKDTVNEMHGN